jgi:hypothetical protein
MLLTHLLPEKTLVFPAPKGLVIIKITRRPRGNLFIQEKVPCVY